jgi:uncharacterized protein (DUF4213/DUF364 family)
MQKLAEALLNELRPAEVRRICIGLHWTAVAVVGPDGLRCGLASTIRAEGPHGTAEVPQAGQLETLPALELARLALEASGPLAGVGAAAINAMLPPPPPPWHDVNAELVLGSMAAGRRLVLVGHFPFVDRLRAGGQQLTVIERQPLPGDMPESQAAGVVPEAEVVAITGMAWVNHSLEGLLSHVSPKARLMMLGPSTPLSPLLFERGFDILSGSQVTDAEGVLKAVSQGANFRQVHHAGVRLITVLRPGLELPVAQEIADGK